MARVPLRRTRPTTACVKTGGQLRRNLSRACANQVFEVLVQRHQSLTGQTGEVLLPQIALVCVGATVVVVVVCNGAKTGGVTACQVTLIRHQGHARGIKGLLELRRYLRVDANANGARAAMAAAVEGESSSSLRGTGVMESLDAPHLLSAERPTKLAEREEGDKRDTHQGSKGVPVQPLVAQRLEIVELKVVRLRPRHAVDQCRSAQTLSSAHFGRLAAALALRSRLESPVDGALPVSYGSNIASAMLPLSDFRVQVARRDRREVDRLRDRLTSHDCVYLDASGVS